MGYRSKFFVFGYPHREDFQPAVVEINGHICGRLSCQIFSFAASRRKPLEQFLLIASSLLGRVSFKSPVPTLSLCRMPPTLDEVDFLSYSLSFLVGFGLLFIHL